MRVAGRWTSHLLSITLGLMFLGSGALRPSNEPFFFLDEQTAATSNDITKATSSPTSQPPEGTMYSQTEPPKSTGSNNYENGTNITEEGNATLVESDAEKIKGRLGPHNTPMGTPSHSKGIAFIDDEKEQYKCYACKGKACALTQTSDSNMCNTTRRACWMTFTMGDGMVTRGCNSPDRSTQCTETYPKGLIVTDGRCSFCCTDNLCNWHVLMNSTCVNLNSESSAPSIFPLAPSTLSTILFTLLSFYY